MKPADIALMIAGPKAPDDGGSPPDEGEHDHSDCHFAAGEVLKAVKGNDVVGLLHALRLFIAANDEHDAELDVQEADADEGPEDDQEEE